MIRTNGSIQSEVQRVIKILISQPATLNTSCPCITSVVLCLLASTQQCTVIRSPCCPSSTMVTSSQLMPRTVSVVLAAVLKTMLVGTVLIWQRLDMVLSMIAGTHPMLASTHSGKYSLMETCHWLLSIIGKYVRSDLVCRTGSLRIASA